MRQRYPEIEAAGARVLAIGFGPREQLRELATELDLPFPLLHDPAYTAYHAFDLKKGSHWAIYGPRTIWAYIPLILRGRRLRRTTVDAYQLGGDFVVDASGIVRLAHPSRGPADRASVAQLVAALRAAAKLASP